MSPAQIQALSDYWFALEKACGFLVTFTAARDYFVAGVSVDDAADRLTLN